MRSMKRTTLTRIGEGMPSEDAMHYRFWKTATRTLVWFSVLSPVAVVAAVAFHTPRLALVAPLSLMAFAIAQRERNLLAKILRIRFEAAMNLNCGPNDTPYRYNTGTEA